MLKQIQNQLQSKFSAELINSLFSAYKEMKEKYYTGNFRPAALEGGRFAEAAIRMLQQLATGSYTPLGRTITNFTDEVRALEGLPRSTFHESIRIQIPRTLQVIYDIRNKRDVGHLGGDLHANYTDATLCLVSCNWVLAEFFRIFNVVGNIDEAQKIVDSIIKFRIPIIQEFDGFLKILNPSLSVKSKILVILYHFGDEGTETKNLYVWLKNISKQQILNALNELENKSAYIHRNGNDKTFITDSGRVYTEGNIQFNINT